MQLSMRRSTVLADVRVGRAARTSVGGVDTGVSLKYPAGRCLPGDPTNLKADIAQELRQKLKDYMNGFMNDPSRTDGLGRDSWPGVDGTPGQAWDSPLAHRKFFEWRAGVGGCIDKAAMNGILSDISMDTSICAQSVAEGLINTMNKPGGDDGCTSWPEYLNSMFHVGPVSDSGAPDPTDGVDGAAPADGGTTTPTDRFAGYTMGGSGGPGLGNIGIKEKIDVPMPSVGPLLVKPTPTTSSGVGSKTLLIGAGIAAAFIATVIWLRP